MDQQHNYATWINSAGHCVNIYIYKLLKITFDESICRDTIMLHYKDVIMSEMVSQITTLTSVYSTDYIQVQIKENIKAPHHWPWCGEFTGDWWIPRTTDKLYRKSFHLMTSSWVWSHSSGFLSQWSILGHTSALEGYQKISKLQS